MLDIQKYSKIIAANWKMNGSIKFVDNFLKKIVSNNQHKNISCNIICPPYVYIQYLYNNPNLHNFYIGGQDCSLFHEGAYTGDISASMLKDIQCSFCIVGHSERRKNFNETNEDVFKKASNCLKSDINPIICVGETYEEKENNQTKEILLDQITKSIPINANNNNTIIAYEPIWAIGTGLTPSLEEINEIHNFIKNKIQGFADYKILYGGSVTSSNSKAILNLNNVDGVLIGGASLDIEEINKILSF